MKICGIDVSYKYVCSAIWVVGVITIGVTLLFNKTFLSGFYGNYIVALLVSSIPFAVLAFYAKMVFENKTLGAYDRNLRFSGIWGAFINALLYALWAFSFSMEDALNPAGLFWVFSIKVIIPGAIIAAFTYIISMRIYTVLAIRRHKTVTELTPSTLCSIFILQGITTAVIFVVFQQNPLHISESELIKWGLISFLVSGLIVLATSLLPNEE